MQDQLEELFSTRRGIFCWSRVPMEICGSISRLFA
jgi:hypothetical protein